MLNLMDSVLRIQKVNDRNMNINSSEAGCVQTIQNRTISLYQSCLLICMFLTNRELFIFIFFVCKEHSLIQSFTFNLLFIYLSQGKEI